MKKILFITLAAVTLLMSSCAKEGQKDAKEGQMVSITLGFTLSADNVQNMSGTKSSNSEIFDEFYQKILSGELAAPTYHLTFTEKNTGAVYTVDGTWAGRDTINIRTGTYTVTGTSTATGENVQDKCSLKFNDEVFIDTGTKTITLKADYDCSLIIFSDPSVKRVLNFNGIDSTDLFKFNSYIYTFVHTKLWAEGKQSSAYLEDIHSDDTRFRIYTGNLTFEIGKYYVFGDVRTLKFTLDKMEEGDPVGKGIVNLFLKINSMAETYASEAIENNLRDVQVLMYSCYEMDTVLYRYYRFTNAEIVAKKAEIKSLNVGKYRIIVMANAQNLEGDTAISRLSSLRNIIIPLEQNVVIGTAAQYGLTMNGFSDITVINDSSVTQEIDLYHYVGKIYINKIVNMLPKAYGDLIVKCAFISNVVDISYLDAYRDLSPVLWSKSSTWANKEGRKDGSDLDFSRGVKDQKIIEKSDCRYCDLTGFNFPTTTNIANGDSLKPTDCIFYGFKNSSVAEPAGYHEPDWFGAQMSMLVLYANTYGNNYYYPIVLDFGDQDALKPNTSYKVDLTILGIGTDEPNKKLSKGNVSITIQEMK